jgi:hypothetical protein
MNGALAQIVALTCHGNAFIGGSDVPRFFPVNSTCQFCKSIQFIEFRRPLFAKAKEGVVAGNPDEWIAGLRTRGATGIRLLRKPQDDPRISDRMSAGFVGGGGTWMMEVMRERGRSEFWAARWEVGDQNAPDRRIWVVTYGLVGEHRTGPDAGRALSAIKRDFKTSLEAIHAFSLREDCGGFTDCFARALKALDDPTADVGYHKDLAVPDQLTREASSILKASMSAWVFGAMGSWNDMGFDGVTREEYENVSESLFRILNEAIAAAATSTVPEER